VDVELQTEFDLGFRSALPKDTGRIRVKSSIDQNPDVVQNRGELVLKDQEIDDAYQRRQQQQQIPHGPSPLKITLDRDGIWQPLGLHCGDRRLLARLFAEHIYQLMRIRRER
jgi:hypothetical protein